MIPQRALLTLLGAAVATLALTGSAAGARTVWLCRPGLSRNPCASGLATTVLSPTGGRRGVTHPKPARHPKIDCFYVYPTVSDQKSVASNRRIGPEERSIALYQVARYSQYCRVFAPMYRQLTLAGVLASPAQQVQAFQRAYADVAAAWRDYLVHFNHGRGFVLIGHSQGTLMLTTLIRRQIDGRARVRRRLLSAILLGGNILAKSGSDAGGDFRNIPACRSPRQLGCVVAYSTFDQPPPANTLFGTPSGVFTGLFGGPQGAGYHVLCTNPAGLRTGVGSLDSIVPSKPFAPGTILGAVITSLGYSFPKVKTPWIEVPHSFAGSCSDYGDATVLEVNPLGGGPTPRPVPDATWGEHLLDFGIALGNLVRLVHSESAAYAHRR